jgi:hypothetical protein
MKRGNEMCAYPDQNNVPKIIRYLYDQGERLRTNVEKKLASEITGESWTLLMLSVSL